MRADFVVRKGNSVPKRLCILRGGREIYRHSLADIVPAYAEEGVFR